MDNLLEHVEELRKLMRSAPAPFLENTELKAVTDKLFAELDAYNNQEYPKCDYCGVVPEYHPWHGSGEINGVVSPHIHACNTCRHLLPSEKGMQLVWLNIETGKFSTSWAENDPSTNLFSVDEQVKRALELKDEREKPQWKLLRYECLSDSTFQFIPAMRLA